MASVEGEMEGRLYAMQCRAGCAHPHLPRVANRVRPTQALLLYLASF